MVKYEDITIEVGFWSGDEEKAVVMVWQKGLQA